MERVKWTKGPHTSKFLRVSMAIAAVAEQVAGTG